MNKIDCALPPLECVVEKEEFFGLSVFEDTLSVSVGISLTD